MACVCKFYFYYNKRNESSSKSPIFCFMLAKKSGEFYKGWDYNIGKIYKNQNCYWSLLWIKPIGLFGSNWVIKNKKNWARIHLRKINKRRKLLQQIKTKFNNPVAVCMWFQKSCKQIQKQLLSNQDKLRIMFIYQLCN